MQSAERLFESAGCIFIPSREHISWAEMACQGRLPFGASETGRGRQAQGVSEKISKKK